ncbi:MAG TPA: conserved virulence factor C family protein [Bacillales bacterium]|nr:conserved virulence factor C family protein [Bacillales bacterium]
MKILSIEPTPSPNTMKLNMDESLPGREARNFKEKDYEEAPEYAQKLLAIDGVKGLYHVADFIALERDGKVDWQSILPRAREIFGEGKAEPFVSENRPVTESYGAVDVFIQMFRGIPMQAKLVDGDEERRVGLPERFMAAAMKAGESSPNMIMERKWVEQGARYGTLDEIAENVAEEINAAYDEKRLEDLVTRAFEQEDADKEQDDKEVQKITEEMLDDPDWKKRYAALDRMDPTLEDLPVLRKALGDPKMSIRRLAVVYLGMIEKPEVLPDLYRALEDKSVTVRRTAGDCLSDLGNRDAIGPMTEALKDPSRIVRWRAAMFLYEVGDESAVPALREAQDDPEFEVSMQVKMALERIEKGKAAEGSVWKQMTENLSQTE